MERRTFIEDNGTARAARAQLWEWVQHAIRLEPNAILDRDRLRAICIDEADRLGTPPHVRALLQHVCLARTPAAFVAAERVLAHAPIS